MAAGGGSATAGGGFTGPPLTMRPLMDKDSDLMALDCTPTPANKVMISDKTVDLGDLYKKCRDEKEKSLTMNIMASSSIDSDEINYATMTAPATRIGSFETNGEKERFGELGYQWAGLNMSPYCYPLTRQRAPALLAIWNTPFSIPAGLQFCASVTRISSPACQEKTTSALPFVDLKIAL
jgi:hypothetical protein